jgi:hypothetical protein
MSEIKTFSPDQLQDRITETVRSQFGMLIPEEQFNELIKKEIKEFFETEVAYDWEVRQVDNWSNHTRREKLKLNITPFRQQVWSEVRKLVDNHIQTTITTGDFETNIISSINVDNESIVETHLSAMLETKLQEIAPKMASAMFKDMFGQAVINAKAEIVSESQNNNQY